MTDIKLLPLPEWLAERDEKTKLVARNYARAVAEHNVAELVDDRDDLLARLDASIDHGTKLGAAQQRCIDEVLEQKAEIEALRAEVERLRQAVADNITDSTMLRHMNVTDGGLHLGLEGGGAQLLAETFAHQFMESGALNFLEVAFTHEKLGKLIVTLQRVDGLTPADKTKAAEAHAKRLAEALQELVAYVRETSHHNAPAAAAARAALRDHDQEAGDA